MRFARIRPVTAIGSWRKSIFPASPAVGRIINRHRKRLALRVLACALPKQAADGMARVCPRLFARYDQRSINLISTLRKTLANGYVAALLGTLPALAQARPMGFKDSWMAMGDLGPNRQEA